MQDMDSKKISNLSQLLNEESRNRLNTGETMERTMPQMEKQGKAKEETMNLSQMRTKVINLHEISGQQKLDLSAYEVKP